MLILALSIGIVLATLMFVFLRKIGKKRRKEEFYERFAKEHSLKFTKEKAKLLSPQLFVLDGEVENTSFRIHEEIVSTGKSQHYYTHITIHSPIDYQFKIGRENFFTRLGKLIGFTDIEFNDYDVDRKYLFKSEKEEEFRKLINYEVLSMLNLKKEDFRGRIDSEANILSYKTGGEIESEEKYLEISGMIELMLLFNKRFEDVLRR